jgi:hypothetical protein
MAQESCQGSLTSESFELVPMWVPALARTTSWLNAPRDQPWRRCEIGIYRSC